MVLKVVAPSILHKTEVGGLALDVRGVMPSPLPTIESWPSHPMPRERSFKNSSGGHEILIGMAEDPLFGPLLAFGLGGIFVELLGDVAFRLHPLTDVDAAEMISEVKASKLLDGYRGGDPGDIPALRTRCCGYRR